ncbi:TIGR03089 family protein, partial [Salmonella enterica subsp. enterica serovar Typhimurium]|nr:TIGR03089 family protein [Salmonella enterica subsp. enterica serovar Typhimurium]
MPAQSERRALPLLTWYHGADRGELSARTLLTWVTKSVYL